MVGSGCCRMCPGRAVGRVPEPQFPFLGWLRLRAGEEDGKGSLMWGGIKVSMLASLFGVLILAFAYLLWFVLQLRWRLLVADEVEEAI